MLGRRFSYPITPRRRRLPYGYRGTIFDPWRSRDGRTGNVQVTYTTAVVPEPASLILLLAGAGGIPLLWLGQKSFSLACKSRSSPDRDGTLVGEDLQITESPRTRLSRRRGLFR